MLYRGGYGWLEAIKIPNGRPQPECPKSFSEIRESHTSSILHSFQPSNCMMILCSWVPWRNASTLGASA